MLNRGDDFPSLFNLDLYTDVLLQLRIYADRVTGSYVTYSFPVNSKAPKKLVKANRDGGEGTFHRRQLGTCAKLVYSRTAGDQRRRAEVDCLYK